MRKIIILLFLFFPVILYSQNLKKLFYYDKKEIQFNRLPDKEYEVTILRYNDPVDFINNNSENLKQIKSYTVKGKKIKINLIQRIFTRKRYYKYTIKMNKFSPGLYRIKIIGTKLNKEYHVLISQYKLISRILNNRSMNFFIHSKTGEPVKDYHMEIFEQESGKTGVVEKNKDFFYSTDLMNKDYILYAVYSNHYDFQYIKKEQIQPLQDTLLLDILLPKNHYHIGENLSCLFLLKKQEQYNYMNISLNNVEISIFDQNNELKKYKKIKQVTQGYIAENFIIDDNFKEGLYSIQIKVQDYIRRKKIYILNRYQPQFFIQIVSDKQTYYFDDKIILNIDILHKYGQFLKEGEVQCDILYKKLNSTDSFHLLKTVYPKLKKGKIRFRPDLHKYLEEDSDYFIKFIIKVRSNNGYYEAEYYTIKLIRSDFSLKINNEYNLYEVEKPIILEYKLDALKADADISEFKCHLHKIKDYKERSAQHIQTKSLKRSQNQVQFNLKRGGYYKAVFSVEDVNKHVLEREIYFWVLSYTYGIEFKEQIDDIIIVQNKKTYDHSDIGKILIIFPEKNIWYNLFIEGYETYLNRFSFSEKNFILFDFPIYEKYSPEVLLKVVAFNKNRLLYNNINIQVPYISKFLKINSELSNINSKYEVNAIKMKPFNFWEHNTESFLLFYNIDKNFLELYSQDHKFSLYNQQLYSHINPHFILYGKDSLNENQVETKSYYNPGFIYNKNLFDSFCDYKLFYLNKEDEKKKYFMYYRPGIWLSCMFAFTDDTKVGYKQISHFYKNDFKMDYYYPEYLSTKDRAFFKLFVKNNKNLPSKFKFQFNIFNGRYRSQMGKYLTVDAFKHEELLLAFHPKFKSTTKILLQHITPTVIDKKEFYIKTVIYPDIIKKRNKKLKVKKYYYKLKYYSDQNNYYSKLKKRWFGLKYDCGDDIVIRFKIKVKEDFQNIRIVNFIPGGFEFIEQTGKYHLYKVKPFQNFGVIKKDNKIIIHIPDISKGVYNIYCIFKAKIAGEYFLPGYLVMHHDKEICSYPENDYVTIE